MVSVSEIGCGERAVAVRVLGGGRKDAQRRVCARQRTAGGLSHGGEAAEGEEEEEVVPEDSMLTLGGWGRSAWSEEVCGGRNLAWMTAASGGRTSEVGLD